MPRSRFFVDIGPLRRSQQYRRLYSSLATSSIGLQLPTVAIPYEIYRLTGSTLQVGAISLVQLVGLLVGAFVGGTLADRLNRRDLLLVAQVLKASLCVLLGLNALGTHPNLWVIYVLAAVLSFSTGGDSPVRTALFMSLIEPEEIVTANTLWQMLFQISQIAGPAIGGVVIARWGIGQTFLIAAGLAVLSTISILRVDRPSRVVSETAAARSGVLEGLRFLRRSPVLQGTFIVDLNAMIFGMPTALFPALAIHHFHGGAATFGLLNAAPAAGALVVASMMGWAQNIRRTGLAVLIAVVLWGAGIVGFGFSSSLALGLFFLAVAGGADVISAVFRTSMLQMETPDDLRGRLQGVQAAVVMGGPRLGNFEAGVVASISGSVEFSVVSGGLACIAGVIVQALAMPSFAKYVSKIHANSSPSDGEPMAPGLDEQSGELTP